MTSARICSAVTRENNMIPSVGTLREIAGDRAAELRRVLEHKRPSELLDAYPSARSWYTGCWNEPPSYLTKLYIADEILGTCGVEGVSEGNSSRSPAFDYCNTGDSYAATLIYIHGKGFRVTSWGDMVERGHYD